jgi:2'-5' RNA ligase
MAVSGALTGWRAGRTSPLGKGGIPTTVGILGGGQALAAQPPSPQTIPNAWNDSWLGPGKPIAPLLTSYRDQARELEPRTMSYPANINATLAPRLGYGLMSFADLRYFAENVPEASMCIRLLTEEMKTFQPTLLGPDGEEVDVRNDLPELYWMVSKPDGRNRWPVWLGRFIYNIMAYDAGALSFRLNGQGKIRAMRVIDGSTIFALVDEHGEAPLAPAPAYISVIWGIPRQTMSTDQLWYQPRALRADAPYGRSFIEDSLQACKWLEQFWLYQIAEWTEGNMPEMLVPAPVGWPDEKIREWEASLNAGLAGNPAGRAMRIKFIPAGFGTPIEKKTVFNVDAYTTALERVAFAAGIPPTELGKTPGKGLGGKGFSDKMESAFFRMGLDPLKTYIEQPFNDVLDRLGYEGYEFFLKLPEDSADPEKESAALEADWTSGAIKRNEYRTKRGYEADDTPAGDVYYPFPSKGDGDGAAPGGAAPGASSSGGDDGAGGPPKPNVMPGNGNDPAHPRVVHRVTVKGANGAAAGALNLAAGQGQAPVDGAKGGTVTVKREGMARVVDGTPNSEPVSVKPQEPAKVNTEHGIFNKLAKAKAKDHDGSMVAVMLPAATAEALAALRPALKLPAEAEYEPAESMHVTLAYFPEALDSNSIARVFGAMQAAAFDFGQASLEGRVQGFGFFDNEAGCVLWANLDAVGLNRLRTKLCEGLDAAGITYGTDHDFTPHITLAYLPIGAKPKLPELPDDLPSVSITGLTFSLGDNYMTAPFSGGGLRLGKLGFVGTLIKDWSEVQRDENGQWVLGGGVPKDDKGALIPPIPEPAGGGTFQPMTGHTVEAGKDKGFAVAISDKYEQQVPPSKFFESPEAQRQVMSDYIWAHRDQLTDPHNHVGVYASPKGTVYLDISRVYDSRQEAIEYGKSTGQESIFSFQDFGTLYLDTERGRDAAALTGSPIAKRSAGVEGSARQVSRGALGAFAPANLAKHCGVCEEDEVYFGAPIAKGADVPMPIQGANESQIVAIVPEGEEPRAGVFKPEVAESAGLQARVGGEQYAREEAAYLLSRSLGFDLVPVTFVAEVDGQTGSVQHYVMGAGDPQAPLNYSPEWVERAAVFDYITGQSDRRTANYLTHPDDPSRPIFIDNGLSFPAGPVIGDDPFVEAQGSTPFSSGVMDSLTICVGDEALWSDLKETLGKGPATAARIRTRALLTAGRVPSITSDSSSSSSASPSGEIGVTNG